MNSKTSLLALAIISVLAVLLVNEWRTPVPAPPLAAKAQAADSTCTKDRSIQVSGAAVVNVVPDRALIQLGVQSNGTTPDGTHAENIKDTQKVVNAIRALGVEAKDIATDYLIVYPVYENYNELQIKGYRVNNTVSVTVRNVELADDILLAALRSGANEVQDIQFYSSDLRKYRDQARDLAMKAAGEKAQALSQAAGAQAGCVLTVSENIYSQYYGSWRGGREMAMWAQNVVQNAQPGQAAPAGLDGSPINLGQIAVRAEVSASYSLK